MKKLWPKLLIRVLTAVAGLFFLAFLFLLTPPGKNFIFEQLRSYLRSRSGIELRISGFRLNVFRGTVILEHPVIQSAARPDLPPLFKADSIHITVDLPGLIRGNRTLDSLKLAAPQIQYFVGQNGETNLPEVPTSSGSATDLLILHAEANDGSFTFRDREQEISVVIPQWQLTIDGIQGTFDHRIAFGSRRESIIEYKNHRIPINSVGFSGTLQQTAVRIDRAQIVTAASTLSGKGSINNFDRPSINLELTTDLDLSEIARIASTTVKARGRVQGTILADGWIRDPRIAVQIRGSDVSIRDYERTDFDIKAQTEWSADSGKLTIRDLDLASPMGDLRLKAELFPSSDSGDNSIKARIQNFNFMPIWKGLNPPFDLATKSSGEIELRWKGAFDPSKLSGRAHIDLIATRSEPALNLLPISGILDAQMRSSRIVGDLKSFAVLGTDVSGRFVLASLQDIEGNFQGEAKDIDTLMAQLSQFLGMPDYLFGIKMKGPVRLNVQASDKLRQPKIVATMEAPDLQLGQLKNLKASAEATIQGSRIDIQNTIYLPQNSTLHIQGNLELGGEKIILNLDERSDPIPIAAIGSILNKDIPITGDLKTSLHLNGTTDSLNGNASITGEALALYSEPLGKLDMEVRITGREFQSTRFKLWRESGNPDSDYLDGKFTYILNSGQFQFQAEGKDLTLKKLVLPGNLPIQGSINLNASGAGTINQPSIDIKAESGNVRIGGRSIGPLSLDANLRDEQIRIEAQAPRIKVSSTATIANHNPYPFTAKLKAQNSDLSLFGLKAVNGQLLTGLLDAELTGSGNLRDLSRTDLSAHIQKALFKAGGLEVHTRDPFDVNYRDNSLKIISPASVVSGNSVLEITGGLAINKSAPADTLRLTGQLDLAQAMGFVPVPKGVSADGMLNVDLALSGIPQQLHSSGTIRLNGGRAQIPKIAVPLTDIMLQAIVEDGSLVLQQADASLDSSKIRLSGELPFGLLPNDMPVRFVSKKGPAIFVLDVRDFRPEVTGMLPQGIEGNVSLHAAGEAAGPDLRSLKAQIDLQDLNLKVDDIAFKQKQPGIILVRDGIASIQRLSLTGTQTNIDVSGSAGLYPGGDLNLHLAGDFDAALLTAANQDIKAAGMIRVQVAIAGNRDSPTLSGYADMKSGKLSLRTPRVVADSMTVHLDFTSNQISIRECSGTLNGGSLDVKGTIGYENGTLNNFNLKAALQDVFLNFPEGLKSASGGNLTITSSDDSIVVGGNIRALESSYREPLEVGGRVMDYLKAQQVLEVGQEPNPFLERIRLNISLRTSTPLLVQNNIAKVEASANLTIIGTYYDPSIIGRITLNEGGEIILNQQTYYINRGAITLVNQSYIEPDLNIQAQTKVGTYDITLQLTGTPERLTTALSSEPALSEPDILSLILTGKTVSETQGREMQMVRTQALSLLAGQAGEEVAREARQVLHISTFRIDPGLIASESDPGARLTLGEDITRDFSLAYSMNLVNGGDQIWIAQYNFPRRLATQATRQQDNSYRLELRQDLRLGGSSRRRSSRSAAAKFEIGTIQFKGAKPFSDEALINELKVKPGDRYDFSKVQKGLDRLHDYYANQKRLEADIRMRRETQGDTVNLDLSIDPGPTVDFSFDGTSISESVKKKVEEAWRNGVFETERLDDAAMAIRRPLIHSGFLQSEVTPTVDMENGQKRVHFQVNPGPRYAKVEIQFPGASEIPASKLSNALELADLKTDVFVDPQKVVDFLKRYCHDNGYLQARVDLPQLDLDPETGYGRVAIHVHEGPLFTIGDLEFNGNRAFDYDQLWSVIPTSSGSRYDPETLRDAVKVLENFYHSKGYNEVTIAFRIVQDSNTAHANVTFEITERKKSIIQEIIIEGNRATSQTFVQRQLDFKVGDALDFTKIDVTRRRLYATGVYSSVDFQTEEIPAAKPDSQEKDIRIRIRLRETQPYRLQYGFFYDTDRGPGGLVEVQNLNLLGRATNLGMRLRYDSDLKEGRIYYNQPFVTRIHVKMNASAFIQRETRPYFSANRIGFSLFREKNLPREFHLDYGYRYDHVRWDGLAPDPTLYQSDAPVARLVFTVTRDTRDSFLDATRGEFSSHSLEFGPRFLGSETGFARYFGQYFRYVPLDKFLGRPQKDSTGRRIAPKLFYAGALRLGLTGAFSGREMISPERFFAGGGTTMRGFQQDLLGPREIQDDGTYRPLGGEALFLFNNEIRFPIVSILQGVAFTDLGNVYERLGDFNFTLRKTAGLGLRVKIKYIPLRFDYGFKLDHLRPKESAGGFFFSIGQMF